MAVTALPHQRAVVKHEHNIVESALLLLHVNWERSLFQLIISEHLVATEGPCFVAVRTEPSFLFSHLLSGLNRFLDEMRFRSGSPCVQPLQPLLQSTRYDGQPAWNPQSSRFPDCHPVHELGGLT